MEMISHSLLLSLLPGLKQKPILRKPSTGYWKVEMLSDRTAKGKFKKNGPILTRPQIKCAQNAQMQ
jgi:hypothetical protein